MLLRTKNRSYLWLTALFELLAVFSDKVRFLSLFLIIVCYVLTYRRSLGVNIKKFLLVVFGLLVLSFVYLTPSIILRTNVVNSGYNRSDAIFYNPLFQYPTSIAKYLQLIFLPVDLTLYHTMYIFPLWLNWLITLTYLTCVIYFYFKNRDIFFSLAFIFLAAAPSMAPVKVSWLVAERYMFLGSLGWCMFMGILLQKIGENTRVLKWVILGSFMVIYGVRIYSRNIDWNTNHNLWVNTCQVSPNSHNAWNNIGDDYDKLKDYENAIKGFTQSTVVKPDYADAYHNRANIFFKIGRLDLARDSYTTAIGLSPGLYQTYFSLVQIDMMEHKLDLALEHAQRAVQIQPNNPQSLYVLGVVYAQRGDAVTAMKIFKQVASQYPKFTLARDALMALENGAT